MNVTVTLALYSYYTNKPNQKKGEETRKQNVDKHPNTNYTNIHKQTEI